ncbi:unnamed protein product [Linum tenue]|uniref:Uncharacterized protein n=1 Tax=Linum tenue TaxID=586396 RepID=A0AAV0M381_9ROSI|nr:unnamed protein product [Linum tenue]
MAFLLPNFSPPLLTANNNPKEKPSTSFQLQSSSYLSSFAATATAAAEPAGSSASPSPPLLNSSPPPATNLNHRNNDFYVNLGLAVRTLREDMPSLFIRDLNYDIYRDDITFRDPTNVFAGISNYKLLFWSLRFHGKLLFKDIAVEVYRIWQPSDNVILIRWNVKGIPRVPWEAKGEFQGTSTYKLDRNGKIYEHKVDNLAFNFPQSLKSAGVSIADLVAASPARVNPTFLLWHAEDEKDVPDSACSWFEFYDAVRETVVRESSDALLTCCS